MPVPDGVGDTLLHDPVQDVFFILVQHLQILREGEIHLDARRPLRFLHQLFQRAAQLQVLQGIRPQGIDRVPHIRDAAPCDLRDRAQLFLGRLGRDVHQHDTGLDPRDDPGEGMSKCIMDLSGQTVPLAGLCHPDLLLRVFLQLAVGRLQLAVQPQDPLLFTGLRDGQDHHIQDKDQGVDQPQHVEDPQQGIPGVLPVVHPHLGERDRVEKVLQDIPVHYEVKDTDQGDVPDPLFPVDPVAHGVRQEQQDRPGITEAGQGADPQRDPVFRQQLDHQFRMIVAGNREQKQKGCAQHNDSGRQLPEKDRDRPGFHQKAQCTAVVDISPLRMYRDHCDKKENHQIQKLHLVEDDLRHLTDAVDILALFFPVKLQRPVRHSSLLPAVLLPAVHTVGFHVFLRDQLDRHQDQRIHLFPVQQMIDGIRSFLPHPGRELRRRSLNAPVPDHRLGVRGGIHTIQRGLLQQSAGIEGRCGADAGGIIQAEDTVKRDPLFDVFLHAGHGKLQLALTGNLLHDRNSLLPADCIQKSLHPFDPGSRFLVGQDDQAGLLLAGFFFSGEKILSHQPAGPVIVRYDGAVCQSRIGFRQIGIHDDDQDPLLSGALQDPGQSAGFHRRQDQHIDAHIQHVVDLLDLSLDIERRIPQDHPVALRVHSVRDLFIDDREQLIVHGHIAGPDQNRILLLILRDIRPEKKATKNQDCQQQPQYKMTQLEQTSEIHAAHFSMLDKTSIYIVFRTGFSVFLFYDSIRKACLLQPV